MKDFKKALVMFYFNKLRKMNAKLFKTEHGPCALMSEARITVETFLDMA